jgi:hypothetical protein
MDFFYNTILPFGWISFPIIQYKNLNVSSIFKRREAYLLFNFNNNIPALNFPQTVVQFIFTDSLTGSYIKSLTPYDFSKM